MFSDNGDGTYTIRFYNNGTPAYVTVDRYLPTDSSGRPVYAWFGSNYANTTNELWVALAEKAFVEWHETGLEKAGGKKNLDKLTGEASSQFEKTVLRNWMKAGSFKTEDEFRDYLKNQEKRLQFRRAYVERFARVLPPPKLTRFYQLENRMDAVITYDAASGVPLAPLTQTGKTSQ